MQWSILHNFFLFTEISQPLVLKNNAARIEPDVRTDMTPLLHDKPSRFPQLKHELAHPFVFPRAFSLLFFDPSSRFLGTSTPGACRADAALPKARAKASPAFMPCEDAGEKGFSWRLEHRMQGTLHSTQPVNCSCTENISVCSANGKSVLNSWCSREFFFFSSRWIVWISREMNAWLAIASSS